MQIILRISLNYIMNQTDIDRFWSKVEFTTDCWEWKAGKFSSGYGEFSLNGRDFRAHRISYELFKGKIPQDKEIDHLCRTPSCINPEHLEAVTHRENNNRGIGPTAKNAKKTHCNKGHKFSNDNIYFRKSRPNSRECLKCVLDYNIRYNEKRRLK